MTQHELLTRSIYMFGSLEHGPYGAMTFAPDGSITSRVNRNEYYYRLTPDGSLELLSRTRQVTSTLEPLPSGGFVAKSGYAHYLHPLLSLDPAPSAPARKMPPIFLNTAPKASTYFLSRALEVMGYANLQLHVMPRFLHDNRAIPDSDIHWNPDERRRIAPAHAVANLLRPGEFAVGHIDELEALKSVAATGVKLINVVREPRSQLVSLFAFKQEKVKPSRNDRIWQSMTGVDAFKAFLLCAETEKLLNQQIFMTENFGCLRHEDLKDGSVSKKVVGLRLAGTLSRALQEVRGQPTSTLVDYDKSQIERYLTDPDVARYFDEVGITEFSKRHWPETWRE